MYAGYDNDTTLRIGLDNIHNNSYLMIANDAWRSLEVGQRYTVSIAFDNSGNSADWTGTVTTLSGSDQRFLEFAFSNFRFWKTVAERSSMQIYYRGKFVTGFRLDGTYAAILEVIRCNQQFTGGRTASRDPFQ